MEFITDRTYADVQKVIEYEKRGWKNLDEEEKKEWLAGMKGAINDFDLNRMASNIIEIQKELIKRNTSKIDWQISYDVGSYVYIDNFDYIYIITDVSKVSIEVIYFTDANTVDHREYLENNIAVLSKGNYAFVFVRLYYNGSDFKDTYVGGSDESFYTELEDARTDWKWEWQNSDSDWLPINALPPIINNVNILKDLAYTTFGLDPIVTDLKGFNFQRANQIEEYSEMMHNFAISDTWEVKPEWKTGYIIDESGSYSTEIEDTSENHILTADYIHSIPSDFKIKVPKGIQIKVYKYIRSTYGYLYSSTEEIEASGVFQTISSAKYNSIKILITGNNDIDMENNVSIIV